MRKRVPAKTVTVCDVCHREDGYLTECIVCGKEYCLLCKCCIPGCMMAPDVCKECDDREDVQKVCAKHAPKFGKVLKRRDDELRGLARSVAVTKGDQRP